MAETKKSEMNKIKKYVEHIGDLVGSNQLNGAIAELSQLLKDSPKLNEVLLVSSRYNDLIQKIRLGIINFDDENIEKNKLRMAVLELLENIEDNYSQNKIVQEEFDLKYQNEKSPQIKQNHHGHGDNVIGNKIINNF